MLTFSPKALEHAQHHMQALHQVICMLSGLVLAIKLLDEPCQHWE